MAEKRYTKNGEWLCRHGDLWRAGLSASAAKELGDVTFVEAPVLGRSVAAGEAVCALEAVKAAADYYAPVDGTLAEVNSRLTREPQLVSVDPEGDGWIVALDGVSDQAWAGLLDEAAWKVWEAGR